MKFTKIGCLGILLLLTSLFVHAGTEAKFSIIPTTPTTLQLTTDQEAEVRYQVTNNTKLLRTLTMRPILGISQIDAAGYRSNPFTLLPQASCLLVLNLEGSQLPRHVIGGPEICKTNGPGDNNPSPFLCSQPSVINSLNITVVPAQATLLSIQVLPVNATIPLGTTQQFIANGVYSDGSIRD